MKLTEKELEKALCEVRKAHRLIYEYQRRMQDLTYFIKEKLGFPEYKGVKRFSDPLNNSNSISVDNWSWDWIYSYVYEYELGEQSYKNNCWQLSIIQITDTGFYDKLKEYGDKEVNVNAFEPSSFDSANDSKSKLVFYLYVKNKNSKTCNWNPPQIIKDYATKEEPVIIKEKNSKSVQIVYPVPISKFLNEKTIMDELNKFVEYCNNNTDTNLKIQE